NACTNPFKSRTTSFVVWLVVHFRGLCTVDELRSRRWADHYFNWANRRRRISDRDLRFVTLDVSIRRCVLSSLWFECQLAVHNFSMYVNLRIALSVRGLLKGFLQGIFLARAELQALPAFIRHPRHVVFPHPNLYFTWADAAHLVLPYQT